MRGPTKKLKEGIKYNIDAIKDNGEPVKPKKNADKFIRRCGVLVKDQLTISIQEWRKPAKPRPDLTFVDDRAKKTSLGSSHVIFHATRSFHS